MPITDACDRHRLTTRHRLQLFVEVCQAVQHAHQKGIIHRDLKPSNVMITLHDGKPVPKIIDFGIAKAIGQKLTEKTLFTRYDQMLGTPQYMSPEQAEMSGLDVDTRTDIYSLGVLLYELLTGTTPMDEGQLRASSYSEMLRLIQQQVPPKPSTRLDSLGEKLSTISLQRNTEPARLRRHVRGELDWIVMMALAKDRNRRYESASTFAADVTRYLSRQPVLAGPPSAAYQIRAFSRRHRVVMTVLASVFATLCVGLAASATMYWMAIAARNEERRVNFAADMLIAGFEWNSEFGTATNVRQLVDKYSARGSDEDIRDFTWRHQWTLLNSSKFSRSKSPIVQMAYTPDRQLVTVDDQWIVRYWDINSREPLDGRQLASDQTIRAIALAPNGSDLAVASATEIQMTDAKTGNVKWRQVLDTEPYDLAFSYGQHLATLLTAGRAHVWHVSTGSHFGSVEFQQLAEKDPTGLGRWSLHADLASGGQMLALTYHPSPFLITQYRVGSTKWDTLLDDNGSVIAFKYSPDGTTGAASDSNGAIVCWNMKYQQRIGPRFTVHSGAARVLAFAPSGNLLASGGAHGKIELLDVERRRLVRRFKGHYTSITNIAFSADGTELASCDADGVIHRWNAASDDSLHELSNPDQRAKYVAFSTDGRWMAIAGDQKESDQGDIVEDDFVDIWNIRANSQAARIKLQRSSTQSLTFSPDSSMVAVGHHSGKVTMWEIATGKRAELIECDLPEWSDVDFRPHLTGRRSIGSIAFSPDGRLLATGFGSRFWNQPDYDQAFQIWDLTTKEYQVIQGHQNDVTHVAFLAEGTQLVTSSKDKTVKLWDVGKQELIRTFVGSSPFFCAEICQDERHVFAGDNSGRITAWDIRSGQKLRTLIGHAGRVLDLSVTTDGRTLASCSQDRTVRLWDIQTGRQTRTFSEFNLKVASVAFSSDNNCLVATSNDGSIRVYVAKSLDEIDGMKH